MRLGYHFQGQKVKGQGHQAAMVGCSSHHLTYLDANILYATAQSEPLPADLHKVTTCTGRGHSVLAHYRPHSLLWLYYFISVYKSFIVILLLNYAMLVKNGATFFVFLG